MFQYHRLLHRHLPELANHLDELQVNPVGYFPRWLLSLFAATCPQPLLVRIWDVMFAEGAVETVMRVALAIMQRNQQAILAMSEMDTVLPLLLSRKIWDHYYAKSADELVKDFVGFSGSVTREVLKELEAKYKEAQDDDSNGEIVSATEVQSIAARFLGRLWSATSPSAKSSALSPGLPLATRRSSNFFARASKQSMTSSVMSNLTPSDSTASLASTALTEASSMTRRSSMSADVHSIKSGTDSASGLRIIVPSKESDEDKAIQDLLMALTEAQRQIDNMDRKIRKQEEDRKEDYRFIRPLLDRLKNSTPAPSPSPSPIHMSVTDAKQARRRTTVSGALLNGHGSDNAPIALPEDIINLVDNAAARFCMEPRHSRASSLFETKESLRQSLAQSRELLSERDGQLVQMSQQVKEEQEKTRLAHEALKETRHRLQETFTKNQTLERTIAELRQQTRRPSTARSDESSPPPLTRSNTTKSIESSSGLREFRLGRTDSTRSVKASSGPPPPRTSSLMGSHAQVLKQHAAPLSSSNMNSSNQMSSDNSKSTDELLNEILTARMSEAQARNELTDLQRKYDALRRSMQSAAAGGGGPPSIPSSTAGQQDRSAATASVSSGVAGFWGWGRRTASTSTAGADMR
jgi:hypothetical protein